MFRGKIARAIKFQLKFPTPYFILFYFQRISDFEYLFAPNKGRHTEGLCMCETIDIHRIIVLTDTAKNECDRPEQIEGFFRTRYW